ncbi:MAG: DJ-1/PfpI family protein [Bacteroidales bacterium]|nr:DJ-1/PfpI family protein [Bacteroidales bacterium]
MNSSKTIFIHFAEGFEEVEALTPVDVLRRAGMEIKMISITGVLDVKGAHGIIVHTDALFEEIDYDTGDMIILPGGMPGSSNLDNHENLKEQIIKYYEQGKYIAAICAAPMVFGHLGLLKGRRATCYPGFEEHLKRAYVTTEKVEVSENVITARGMGVAIDFSLKLVELLSGKEKAKELAEKMIVY